jgi:hypothetical protein
MNVKTIQFVTGTELFKDLPELAERFNDFNPADEQGYSMLLPQYIVGLIEDHSKRRWKHPSFDIVHQQFEILKQRINQIPVGVLVECGSLWRNRSD